MEETDAPWKKLQLTPKQEALIYKEFGDHYSQHLMLIEAEKCYDNSIALRPNSLSTLLNRSKIKRNLAKTESALDDLKECTKIEKDNIDVDIGICDYLYELNRLEESLVSAHQNKTKYSGHKTKKFTERIEVLTENFNDSLGPSLATHILKNEKIFEIVYENIKKEYERRQDKRPLWKFLYENDECDVQSTPDQIETIISPLELARRDRESRIFLQTYMNKSWEDITFLRKLNEDTDLLLSYIKGSTPQLKKELCDGNDSINRFLKMLQVRSPVYNEKLRKCPDIKLCERNEEKFLYRIQYQTHRNMHAILNTSRCLRADGKVRKFSDYVEQVMGDYVILKTFRVMPWKNEFINEVYNLLGLTHIDHIEKITLNNQMNEKYDLQILLNLPIKKQMTTTEFVFGRKSTFKPPDYIDPKIEANKRLMERLKKRLKFTKLPIENSYIYHEIAHCLMEQSFHDECANMSRKGIDSAKEANNYVWQFLNVIQIAKARGALNKIEFLAEILNEASEIVNKLNNKILDNYVNLLIKVNNEKLDIRQNEIKSHQFLKSSKRSGYSRISHLLSISSRSIINDDEINNNN